MNRIVKHAATVTGALGLLVAATACSGRGPKGETVDLPIATTIAVKPADARAKAIVATATAFLATLSEAQRKAVVYAFDDNAQRARWSNFPVSFVERGGIMRRDLTVAQKAALDALLGQVLSERGVRNARMQMAADDALVGGPGPGADFGSQFYYVAFLGQPSVAKPWMFQFGGHHLAINVTFVGPEASFSPMLTGGQPLTIRYEGRKVYITREEVDAAQALLASLNPAQRKAAVLGDQPIQLLLGPGEHGTTVAAEGVRGADLTAAQQALLLAVVQARVGQFNARDAQAKMAAVRADLQQTTFGWWGPQDQPGAAYFRITGPRIVQEYAPQHMGDDDPTEHDHSMYRDPANDYGAAWVAARK
ncbi:DUF3500 domain-containing protein [Sphingomonas solaris]|uniref:DUF3500 domain-containing protein n=1 Tax=Alterirhizorhabdus solaris TaxID=2529389 RepID=A0A558R1T5_9SPHN|nr:DUF3500 domain-containing protein [Sphingomonas solaris]TVV73329.1 DUF3500 domain-containing protein [Sphingomonas solaris]